MQIIHFITTIEHGGAEHGVCSLAVTQVKNASQVTIVPLKGRPELYEYLIGNGVRVERRLLNRPFVIQILLAFILLLNNRSSVVHSHLPRAEVLVSISSLWSRRFSTRHNSESFLPNMPGLFSRIVSRICLMNAVLISISRGVNDFLISNGEVSKHRSRNIIYYGFTPRFAAVPNSKSSPTRIWNIGTIARLEKQKNIETLISALLPLKSSGITFQLKILGDGPERAKLAQMALDFELEDYVIFLGKTNDVYPYLASWDVFVLPSLYEGFGLVLLEAIDCGVPIIASDIPPAREV